jgi:hypothetical protein
LKADQYIAGSNWLGVALAALMRVPSSRKVWLRVEALRRILLECPENDYRRLLLQECVEAYLQLREDEQREFERMVHTEPYKEIEPMMLTTFEKGVAKGREEGRPEIARLLLEHKFGALPETALARLAAWSSERLGELILAVNDAPSLQALGLEADEKPS